MKKCLVSILLLCILVSCGVLPNDLSDKKYELLNSSQSTENSDYIDNSFNINSHNNYHISNDKYVVYGNYVDFDINFLHSLTHDDSKICVFYDLDLTDNISDKYEIFRNNAVVYYYKNGIPNICTYKSNATDTSELINDISAYVNEIIKKIQELQLSARTIETDTQFFDILYESTFTEERKPYGLIKGDYIVRKYRANDVSSLYLVESDIMYIPGGMGADTGSTSYGNWYNSNGYIKIKAECAEFDVGYDQIRYGGKPIFKDAYPINSPNQVVITSTYTEDLQLGYSFVNGFSLYDVSSQVGSSFGSEIVYSYNKAYTTTEPAMIAQYDMDDHENDNYGAAKYVWTYKYSSPKIETNHLSVGYIFEMNNKGHDLYEGDVAIRIEYMMKVTNDKPINSDDYQEYVITDYLWHNYY